MAGRRHKGGLVYRGYTIKLDAKGYRIWKHGILVSPKHVCCSETTAMVIIDDWKKEGIRH